jgi:hypothetical protein
LVEREGKWLSHLGRVSVVWVSLLNFDGHIELRFVSLRDRFELRPALARATFRDLISYFTN